MAALGVVPGGSGGRNADGQREIDGEGCVGNPKKSSIFLRGKRGGIWGGAHLMVLPVRMRIHWGRGRFCFCFLPSFCLILKVFWDGC